MGRLFLLAALFALLLAPATQVGAQGASLTVLDPKDGASVNAKDITVSFTTTDIKLVPTSVPVSEAGKHPEANHPGEGHIHFVLDLQPLVVWEKADPYTFTNVPTGQHQLMVELVQNDHSSFSPRIMQTISFQTTGSQPAPAAMPPTGALQSGPWLALLSLAALLMLAGVRLLRRAQT
jgi:hypothetical protein